MFQTGQGIAGPPTKLRQNETAYWQDVPFTDEFSNQYDSGTYTLTYVFAGVGNAPLSVTATPGSAGTVTAQGWTTRLTPTQAAQLLPGRWWWQAVLTAPAVGMTPAQRVVAAEGEVLVEPDLATLSGSYDGRTQWQIILANCEQALAVFQASGSRLKEYEILGRRMSFEGTGGIIELATYARGRVEAEKQAGSGGDRRNIRIGFSPPTSGVPAVASKNWPWW